MTSAKTRKMARFVLLLVLSVVGLCHFSQGMRSNFIIHMAKSQMPEDFEDHTHWYDSSLRSVSGSAEMLYVYNNAVHGFAATLTSEEAESLKNQPGILSVLPEIKYELHTTRTPSFLGLDRSADFFPESNAMGDVIVGVLDTGVWPESKSFDDNGFGPIPASWKGECESGTNFSSNNCNRKLIGARYEIQHVF